MEHFLFYQVLAENLSVLFDDAIAFLDEIFDKLVLKIGNLQKLMQKLNLDRFAQTVILIHKYNSKPSHQHRSSHSPYKGDPLPLLKHKFSHRFNINLVLAISSEDLFPQVFENVLRRDSFLVYELYFVLGNRLFVQLF